MSDKHSTEETGHNKNLQNFKRFIKFIERNTPPYNPVLEKNKLTNLKKLFIKAEKAHKEVLTTNAPIITLTNSRQTLYQPMEKLSTRVLQALEAATADKKIVADAVDTSTKSTENSPDPKPKTTRKDKKPPPPFPTHNNPMTACANTGKNSSCSAKPIPDTSPTKKTLSQAHSEIT